MKRIVTAICEKQPDGWSCLVVNELSKWSLIGYGATKEEAVEDMYLAYRESCAIAEREGRDVEELEFEIKDA